MNACVLDIETTDFAAVGAGMMLCAVIKPLQRKPIIFRYDELNCPPGRERKLIQVVINELSKYDLWIGHYLDGFDWPWLKSRAWQFGIGIKPRYSFDTWKSFRRVGFKTQSHPKTGRPKASLGHAVDFFGIPQQKTRVGFSREHWQTVWGTDKTLKKAMDVLVKHCIADVVMNEQLYWHLLKIDTGYKIGFLK